MSFTVSGRMNTMRTGPDCQRGIIVHKHILRSDRVRGPTNQPTNVRRRKPVCFKFSIEPHNYRGRARNLLPVCGDNEGQKNTAHAVHAAVRHRFCSALSPLHAPNSERTQLLHCMQSETCVYTAASVAKITRAACIVTFASAHPPSLCVRVHTYADSEMRQLHGINSSHPVLGFEEPPSGPDPAESPPTVSDRIRVSSVQLYIIGPHIHCAGDRLEGEWGWGRAAEKCSTRNCSWQSHSGAFGATNSPVSTVSDACGCRLSKGGLGAARSFDIGALGGGVVV